MPTANPMARRASDRHQLSLEVGYQMTFNAKLTSVTDGEEEIGGAMGPPELRLLGLQMLQASYRHRFAGRCDWAVDGGLSKLGGAVRCGLGNARRAVSLQLGAHWLPLTSVQGHGELQLGYRGDYLLAFFTAGLVGSRMTYARQEQTAPEDLLLYFGPSEPWLEITQSELAGRLGLLLGFSDGTGKGFLYGAFTLEAPFVTSQAEFRCHGCTEDKGYLSFEPGLRFGVSIGAAL